jgi:hypothetical protein
VGSGKTTKPRPAPACRPYCAPATGLEAVLNQVMQGMRSGGPVGVAPLALTGATSTTGALALLPEPSPPASLLQARAGVSPSDVRHGTNSESESDTQSVPGPCPQLQVHRGYWGAKRRAVSSSSTTGTSGADTLPQAAPVAVVRSRRRPVARGSSGATEGIVDPEPSESQGGCYGCGSGPSGSSVTSTTTGNATASDVRPRLGALPMGAGTGAA